MLHLLGAVLGDPHFLTFDDVRYTFNGKGEYHLVLSPDRGLSVQGRTEQVKLENGEFALHWKRACLFVVYFLSLGCLSSSLSLSRLSL